MAFKLTDAGGKLILGIIFGTDVPDTNFEIILFAGAAGSTINTLSMADADVDGTHTEAVGGGYVQKTVDDTAVISLDASNIPLATFAPTTWTFTGPLTTLPEVIGYGIVGVDSLKLYFMESINPFKPQNNEDQLTITPKVRLGNGTPT